MKVIQNNTTSNNAIQQKQKQPFFQKKRAANSVGKAKSSFFSGNTPSIQTKLSIGQPGDKYEQEVDAMADKVVQRLSQAQNPPSEHSTDPVQNTFLRTSSVQTKCNECAKEEQLQKKEVEEEMMGADLDIQTKPIFESNEEAATGSIQTKLESSTFVQAKCSACEQEEQQAPNLQPKSTGAEAQATPSLESRLNSSKGGGQALSTETRDSMEGAFGSDFSNVRIHTDSGAVQMNKELGAHAFTHGSDIYFNSGQYNTGSQRGQHLLAHELTHTVQQGGIKFKKIQREIIEEKIYKRDSNLEEQNAEEEARREDSVPDGTPVDEDHAKEECIQLVPPYPEGRGRSFINPRR